MISSCKRVSTSPFESVDDSTTTKMSSCLLKQCLWYAAQGGEESYKRHYSNERNRAL